MIRRLRNILAAALLAAAPAVSAQNASDPGFNVIPDKSVATDDGVRLTICLVGIPSTSQRIDGIDLVDGKTVIPATDIDGVDFKRYFQFEDTGVQVIEVDFPFKGAIPKTATLLFHTEKGEVKAPARQ
ncbi:MAG: hypothetical protein NC210_02865 [[Clostridium] fimetarium]|nr:hypothetical protein [Alistipes timonensis]MCM1405344.1 hypothetical protein [[Clostridium] fimetarium]